jgi:acetylornithine/N-succinyldiaminopimelate aminotransferase
MNVFEREEKYFFKTYKRLNLEIEKGEGSYLISKDSVRYLDMFGGLAVNALGYNHPKINGAIVSQIQKYLHLSNMFVQDSQVDLAEIIIESSGYKKLFFSNSGTEAMEGAIKLARKWGLGQNKNEIISFSDSFHGRTMGALSLTRREKYRKGYEPFLENTISSVYNDSAEVISKVNSKTLAVVLEFIQGEGGIKEASQEFVSTLFELRNKFGFLIIADEIQSGLGRTGKLFAFNHHDVYPDIVVIAKPLGGGLPLGAFLGNKKVADVFTYGVHGTTFGGNPVACAAGLATVKEILDNGVMENAARVGEYLKQKIDNLKIKYPKLIREVRGKGLMLGIELTFEGEPVVAEMLNRNVLVNCTNLNVIRLLPPLILSENEADFAIEQLEDVLKIQNKN